MRIEDVIGRRIAEGRGELKLSQGQLGEQLGQHLGKPWTRQAVSAAEAGDRAFTAAELAAFALVLGCTVEALLEPPADVDAVTLSDGPPVDSRWFRSVGATNADLQGLAEHMFVVRNDARELHREVEQAYRRMYTALRGRGIEAQEEARREAWIEERRSRQAEIDAAEGDEG